MAKQKKSDLSSAKSQAAEKKRAKDARSMRINWLIIAVFVLAVLGIWLYSRGVYLPWITALSTDGESMNAVTFNYFYRDSYDSFQSAYGDMLTAYGTLDSGKTLDEQEYSTELTWAEFFYQAALQTAQRNMIVHKTAADQGYEISAEGLADIDSQIESLKAGAKNNGYVSVNRFLSDHYGKGCTVANYRDYLIYQATATEFSSSHYVDSDYTEEDLSAWFAENYPDAGADYDYASVNFRLIYFPFSGYEYDASAGTYDFSEENKVTVRQNLQTVLGLYENGEQTEESFAALAETYSSYLAEEGGLFENAIEGDEDTESQVLNWVFSARREYGDLGTVEADSGDYLLYWVGEDVPAWQVLAREGLGNDSWSAWFETLSAEIEITENPRLMNYLYYGV